MYILDSNILIGFLNGDQKIGKWIFSQKENKEFLGISVISKVEVLSLPQLSASQVEETESFLDVFDIIQLHERIANLAAAMRRKGVSSLGDAIILATAIIYNAKLVTNDRLFAKKASDFLEVVSVA